MDHQNHPTPLPVAYPLPPAAPGWNGKTNGFSVAGLTLSMIGCGSPLGLIFGIIGLRQTSRNGDRRGRVFAILSLIVAVGWFAFFAFTTMKALTRTVPDQSERDASGVIRMEQPIRFADLRPGDCVKGNRGTAEHDLVALPCTSPHYGEVFALYTLPDGSRVKPFLPTDEATAGCVSRFEAYAGTRLQEDRQFVTGWTLSSRNRAETHNVVCIVDLAAAGTGSLRR
ncbi:hypothetical protein [Actinoplanes sp. CA-252034]|uniref:DUF4190 domain-containing protein n=1 Tax=Actinoplanes sp. CA-252034 TaxID=3239906 RepID=UPI003D953D11